MLLENFRGCLTSASTPTSLSHHPPVSPYTQSQMTPFINPLLLIHRSCIFPSSAFYRTRLQKVCHCSQTRDKILVLCCKVCYIWSSFYRKHSASYSLPLSWWKGRVYSTQDSEHTNNKGRFSKILVTTIRAVSSISVQIKAFEGESLELWPTLAECFLWELEEADPSQKLSDTW